MAKKKTETATETAETAQASKPTQPPSLGRVVLFHEPYGSSMVAKAAIIAQVQDADEGVVTLRVLEPSGPTTAVRDVPYASEPTVGAWSWPPFVPMRQAGYDATKWANLRTEQAAFPAPKAPTDDP